MQPNMPGQWIFLSTDETSAVPVSIEDNSSKPAFEGYRVFDEDFKNEPVVVAKRYPETIKEAFQMTMAAKQADLGQLAKDYLKEGRCPHCGELGRYHLSVPICSLHGPY